MIEQVCKRIRYELETNSDSERKERSASYLKTSGLAFVGVELPDIHRIVKTNIKGLMIDDLPVLMKMLWSVKTFETRIAAIDVMKEYARTADVFKALEIIDTWIDEADTWGITDPLCSPTIGILLLRDRRVESVIKSWRDSENFWRRRCSVLPYLYLSLKGQYRKEYSKRILDAVTPHISDEEFFVGKAAGWVLRELSKRDPELVARYFETYQSKMTKLVFREGKMKL